MSEESDLAHISHFPLRMRLGATPPRGEAEPDAPPRLCARSERGVQVLRLVTPEVKNAARKHFGCEVRVVPPPAPPPSRTKWTHLVPPPVLTGHAAQGARGGGARKRRRGRHRSLPLRAAGRGPPALRREALYHFLLFQKGGESCPRCALWLYSLRVGRCCSVPRRSAEPGSGRREDRRSVR